MNHCIQLSPIGTGVAVAASATTGRASKATPSRASSSSFVVHALSAALLLAIATTATAAPVGGVVTSGEATISKTGSNTTINQSTSGVVINWQNFSIGAGETVQFVQPGSNAVALNRVLGADPSLILGSLNANGKVFLLNPNGVLFGKG